MTRGGPVDDTAPSGGAVRASPDHSGWQRPLGFNAKPVLHSHTPSSVHRPQNAETEGSSLHEASWPNVQGGRFPAGAGGGTGARSGVGVSLSVGAVETGGFSPPQPSTEKNPRNHEARRR
jgi:hypothetical protein